MRSISRFAVLFGLPTLLLATVTVAAWLALGTSQTGFGPMRLAPLPTPSEAVASPDDSPAPTQLERISPLQAKIRNLLLPFSHSAMGVAASYRGPAELTASALDCMTQAIYYEAAREPELGKRAVAQVIVNRASSAPFPSTICGVVQQGAPRPGCQFTFECDGSLARRPDPALWAAARRVAEGALRGETEPLVGGATHYHADYVFPIWAPTMTKLAKIGVHIFYRWRASTSRPLLPVTLDVVPEPLPEAVSSAATTSGTLPSAPATGTPTNEPVREAASRIPLPRDAKAAEDVGEVARPAIEAPPRAAEAPEAHNHPRRAIPERPLGSTPLW